jgi:hypothetical protein
VRNLLLAWPLWLILGGVGCNDTPTAPTESVETAITSPQTLTYTGAVGPGGSASRSFTVQLRGTATASLSDISPPTALGVGLGIPRSDGLNCLLARSSLASDGSAAAVTANVDVGTFCVQVYAPATAATVTFTVTVVHP